MLVLTFTSTSMIWTTFTRCATISGDSVMSFLQDWKNHEQREKMFWNSAVANEQLSCDVAYLYLYAKYFHNDEEVQNGTALNRRIEEINNYYNEKAKLRISSEWDSAKDDALRYIRNSPYYEGGRYSGAIEIPQEAIDEYIAKVRPDLIPNEKKIQEECASECEAEIKELRYNFKAIMYHETVERVQQLKSLKYVMILPNGQRLTNIENGNALTPEQLNEKITSSYFGHSYTKDFGSQDSSGSSRYLITESNMRPDTRNSNHKVARILDNMKITTNYADDFYHEAEHDKAYALFKEAGIDLYIFSDGFKNDNYISLYGVYNHYADNFSKAPITLALAVVFLILYLCLCVNKTADGEIEKTTFDRIWNDYHFILSGGLIAGAVLVLFYIIEISFFWNIDISFDLNKNNIFDFAATTVITIIAAVLAEYLSSVIRHIKARTLLKHTAIYKIFSFLSRKMKGAHKKIKSQPKKHRIRNKIRATREKLNSRPYKLHEIRKDIWIFLGLYLLGNLIVIFPALILGIAIDDDVFLADLLLIALSTVYNSVIVVFLWKSIKALDQIMRAVDEAEQGNLNVTLDIASMPRWIRKFAQDVQDVQNGMRTAVQEAIKGERMKTELITNVSHDLKTPLTSIVTYVDLLKKRPIDDGEAQEYIGVLDEKSARLKHLIEDLVEASKTTTGNVELHPVNLNLNELAVQSAGENEDALTSQGLEIRLNHQPENPIIVYADNQKTWRIIENLISNVRKYALEGTRVYISVEQDGAFGVFSIKNITREALDVTPEELTQRFVRGDTSRSTEGSGLGLSIAANLCSLQGGKLDISIDGDLFKVTVYLPLVK